MDINQVITGELGVKRWQVDAAVKLIDEGNTIPFIARYRKEVTGTLDDAQLRTLHERLMYLRNLEEKKEQVLASIEEQGKLTEELKKQILAAETMVVVEDLYRPYRPKRRTRAMIAKEKGLEPLAALITLQKAEKPIEVYAEEYVNPEKEVKSVKEAIDGAKDIIAESVSDEADYRSWIRKATVQHGKVISQAKDEKAESVYEMYYEYSEEISGIPNHRILAINRGEKEKKLKVKVVADVEKMEALIGEAAGIREGSPVEVLLRDTVKDAYKRLMAPSLERELRGELTERAEAEAVKVFARNTEKLLMVPPVKGARVIAIDPGYRTGCKVAVIDETGKLKAYTTVYPTEPKKEIAKTRATLKKLVTKYNINTIVIGNGTASRETEEVVASFIREECPEVRYTIVNEAGASVYSASKLATEEYPDLDVTVRGAMSLGRRLQDPLAELVKIPTKSIGVGQYQHDINQSLLEGALADVVENCVNRVGVELNTASPSLLSYVAGINMGIARNIVAYREENGPFASRAQLKKVPKLGEKTFKQCAGFIRIAGGRNPLDNTAVHPESYDAAEAMLELLGYDRAQLASADSGATGFRDIDDRIWEKFGASEAAGRRTKSLKDLAEIAGNSGRRDMKKAVERLAETLSVGVPTLTDIIAEMKKPGRDPREDAPEVVFRNDVRSFEDLKIDMELEGTVRNVVDFGAFVDIGVKNDGLVHISEMSDRYIKHPMEVVSVGDTVKVKIIKIDYDKQRVGLTMKRLK